MYKIKSLPEFTLWLDSLEDKLVKGAILGRLRRDTNKAKEIASLIAQEPCHDFKKGKH